MSIYYKTHGYCLGTHNTSEEKYRQRLQLLLGRTKWVRGYAMGNGYFGHRMAKEMGYKVMAGAWISGDLEKNETELATLICEAKAGYVDIAAVGSEVLYRGDMSSTKLAEYVKRFKKAVPNIPVTVCDTIDRLLLTPEVFPVCDVISAHPYPYWEGISIENALCYTAEKHRQLEKLSGREVIISETGWPSDGDTIKKEAVANPKNALRYFKEFVEWAVRQNVRYFYFAAFDESWKREFEHEQGAHWGRWFEDGIEKPWVNWK